MRMKKIKVYGKEYPMRITMGALLRFKRQTGNDLSRMGNDLSQMGILMYCCVASACNADGVPFDLDLDKFADGLQMDALNAFAETLKAGDGDDDSKKKTELPQTSTN